MDHAGETDQALQHAQRQTKALEDIRSILIFWLVAFLVAFGVLVLVWTN